MALGSKTFDCLVAVTALGILCVGSTLYGGRRGGGGRSVGGVMIDSAGVVRTATAEEKQELANLLRVVVDQPRGKMAEVAELRMVSLKGLQQAITENQQTGKPLPESIAFLAGLQRVQYVFVDEDNQDIVIAGPAEPWKLLDDGSVVGSKSGGAVLQLDDLMVAMRSVQSARKQGISCSIEPTAEGRQRLQQLLRRIKLLPGQNPAVYEEPMKQAFGPQVIRLTGIPADSRFARTLVAADYEMKRIAMGLVASPVDELPSYLRMARNSRHSTSQNPRWWMACNYDAITKTDDGSAWKISGQGVKTLTEQDIVAADGTVRDGGRSDKIAAQWAEKMTTNYTSLSREMPVFGDLRNVMDLTVVATLIAQERLDKKAGLDLRLLAESNDTLEPETYEIPQAVEPQCSFVRGRGGWVVTTSGGVDINGFEVVQNTSVDPTLADTKSTALAASDLSSWWWDK